MTDMTTSKAHTAAPIRRPNLTAAFVNKRYAAERRFQIYGLIAIAVAVAMLGLLLFSIVSKGYTAFQQTFVLIDVTLPEEQIDPNRTGDPDVISDSNWRGIAQNAYRQMFPEVTSRDELRQLFGMFSGGAALEIRDYVLENPEVIGGQAQIWVKFSDDLDTLHKGFIDRTLPEADRRVKDTELDWYDQLTSEDRIEAKFNTTLFTAGDSREPEQAGVLGALVGSLSL
jgi:Domain of unknown function (DUF3333).